MTDSILTIPAFILLLGVLVFFHELGHFTVAKLFGIRVLEFAFGFGPKWLVLFKRNETEYTVHPFPLGGFVRLAGQEPGEEDEPGGFNSKPWWVRYLVYLAGPTMSFVLAYLVFCAMGFTVGVPVKDMALNRVEFVIPGSLAQKAGLKAGDHIVRIGDERIQTGNEMVEIIHNSYNKPLTITVNRNGREFTIQATPEPKKVGDETWGLLGFVPSPKLERVGVVDSIREGNRQTVELLKLLAAVLPSKHIKDAVGGPLSIVNETKESVRMGPYRYVMLMGALSMSLGIINLLPIPVVDGGQMVLLVVEGIKRRRLSRRTMEIAQLIGLATIALLFLLIMTLDVNRLANGQLFR